MSDVQLIWIDRGPIELEVEPILDLTICNFTTVTHTSVLNVIPSDVCKMLFEVCLMWHQTGNLQSRTSWRIAPPSTIVVQRDRP